MTEENNTEIIQKSKRIGVIKTLVDLVFIAFLSGLTTFYLYVGNIKEMPFKEIVLPLLILMGIGWLLYLILRVILKSARKTALLSGIIMAILTNAGMLTNAIGHIAVVILSIAIIAGVSVIIIRFGKEADIEKIVYIVTGVIGALIIFNIVVSMPQLIENKRLSDGARAKAAALEQIEVPAEYAEGNAQRPNVYIFVFDELAGTQCMQEVFGYDNTGFYNDMRALGFTVSDDCTNYKQFTMECLSGLFNLDYVFDYDTDGFFACEEQFRNGRFFRLMKEMGYELYETEISGYVDFIPRIPYRNGSTFSTTEDGKNTLHVIISRSILGPLADVLISPPGDWYEQILTYYTLPESYALNNALTFTHICKPHAPFIYDINGNPVDEENSMNWSDPKYFTEQYEYISKRIVQTMEGVVKNDPDALIMVLSDHGVKPNKGLWNGPQTTYEQSTDTFFAVYTGGRDDLGDITGLSGANVLRRVLNTQYGFNLRMIDAPAE